MAIKAEGVTRATEARRKEQAQYWVYLDGEFKRYGDARLGLMTHALHYGTGVFEGIRGYWSPEHEQLFLLKLREHYRRMQNSVKVLKLKIPINLDELASTTIELIRRNNFRQDVYIRPLAFKSSEEIGVRLHNLKDSFAIYVTPFGNYVDIERGIRCMVSSWRRVDDNAAPARAKITGIYVNSALAKTEAMENGFDEAIMLTHEGHVCEGSAENIFLLRDGKAYTPPTSDNILEGLTRLGMIELLRNELKVEVIERSIDRSELYVADEIFLCGTGAQISPVVRGEHRSLRVRGPLGDPVNAAYGLIDQGSTAVIEMAKAAGLALVPPQQRDPRITTTYGVGELLQHAYDAGARHFIVGIGGSATNDGGAGMAQALGYHLLDEQGHELPPGGLALKKLARIHVGGVHADWKAAVVDLACDVSNPLTGPSGASAVYGPQKGATPEMVAELDAGLQRLAEVIQRDLGVDVDSLPGAGAAGGLGAGLVAFAGARLRPGAEMVMEALKLDERLAGAGLVITCDGSLDSQTDRIGIDPAVAARYAHP